jgi:nitrite reductase/ring-hydroxylating ferredoxin subunit
VLADDELGEGEIRCVEVEGTAVMVARVDGVLCALEDRCAHAGGPLHEGVIEDGTITCPWHQSVFSIRDGALIHGPAAHPQPAWDVRVRDGRVEVRCR